MPTRLCRRRSHIRRRRAVLFQDSPPGRRQYRSRPQERSELAMTWTVACFCGNVYTASPERCDVCGSTLEATAPSGAAAGNRWSLPLTGTRPVQPKATNTPRFRNQEPAATSPGGSSASDGSPFALERPRSSSARGMAGRATEPKRVDVADGASRRNRAARGLRCRRLLSCGSDRVVRSLPRPPVY